MILGAWLLLLLSKSFFQAAYQKQSTSQELKDEVQDDSMRFVFTDLFFFFPQRNKNEKVMWSSFQNIGSSWLGIWLAWRVHSSGFGGSPPWKTNHKCCCHWKVSKLLVELKVSPGIWTNGGWEELTLPWKANRMQVFFIISCKLELSFKVRNIFFQTFLSFFLPSFLFWVWMCVCTHVQVCKCACSRGYGGQKSPG